MIVSRVLPRSWRARVAAGLALLAVVVVGGDRMAARVAAHAVADRFACAAGLSRPPSVRIGGRLFLPQVLAGRFSDLTVVAHDVRRGDVTLGLVHAHLRDVSFGGRDRVHAGHVDVDVTVGYPFLPAEVAGHHVTYRAAGGLLAVDTALTVSGHQVPVTILADTAISGNAVTVTAREIEVLGVRVPTSALAGGTAIDPGLSRPLPALPAGLSYRSLTATDGGLRLTIAGDDITATPSGGGACGGSR
jgi:hypothetical protein